MFIKNLSVAYTTLVYRSGAMSAAGQAVRMWGWGGYGKPRTFHSCCCELSTSLRHKIRFLKVSAKKGGGRDENKLVQNDQQD